METSRFFVANLPANCKEKDLRQVFQDYGEIKNIELKTKENLVDASDIKVIAFVTLYLSNEDAEYCLNDLNWCKIQGQPLKVSLAKESFLERLKREREEAQAGPQTTNAFQQREEDQSELLKAPLQNKRRTFDVNAELDDDEVAPELMISKKRAANSMHNGKIVIQSQDVEPIHVIENKKKTKLALDKKATSADQKRKESLNKKKNQYQQNKSAIQQALQEMDPKKSNAKRIKFSDNESDVEESTSQQEQAKKSKPNLFDSDGEDEVNDFNIKSLPVGKKGQKLLEMQAKQSLDPRFKIDAKFVDDIEEEDEGDDEHKESGQPEDDERQWQMNILEQVVGTKLDGPRPSDKSLKNKKMLRYDPSKDEHQKFERRTEEKIQSKKEKKSKETSTDSTVKTPAPEVSKEVFYMVTDTLAQSLRSRGEGFSLLDMFGKSEQLEERDEQLKQLGQEKILVNNKLEKTFGSNPFSYDTSSESETEEQTADARTEETKEKETNKTATTGKGKSKLKIAMESFFIPKNDQRLKEGSKFFIYNKDSSANAENYEEVRSRLKQLIKNKISKTKKNMANAGYKAKRRKA